MKSYDNNSLYLLADGRPFSSVIDFDSPIEEYLEAFEDNHEPFIHYYTFPENGPAKQSFTRGEFLGMAGRAAESLYSMGLKKGDRVIHAFSENSVYDLAFRLGSVFTGCVPVTINWQSDDNDRIVYKVKISGAKLIIYDRGFSGRISEISDELKDIDFLESDVISEKNIPERILSPDLSYEDERIIVFTSGTTGNPKGVELSHRSCLANRLTFESYFGMSASAGLDLLLVNPLHHSNSSAMSDWGMRRKHSVIHLIQRYSTGYWSIMAEAAKNRRDILVAPMVSRHFDFLQSLLDESKLPICGSELNDALNRTEILIGSAPVGPVTIKRVLQFGGRIPRVRFGSTETCLQVMATPSFNSNDELMEAFASGWTHRYKGNEVAGYYIGREHPPYTRVKIVKSIEKNSRDYFRESEIGEPGYLITAGPNIMSRYTGDVDLTGEVIQNGWYTGLKDIVFSLVNKTDGGTDYYWTARESELLIRGGANYAYDQVAHELKKFIIDNYSLQPDDFQLAVVGMRIDSEHEDSCCVTIELNDETSQFEKDLADSFLHKACRSVSKGAKPDRVRFGAIPRNFKGAVIYSKLKDDFLEWLDNR